MDILSWFRMCNSCPIFAGAFQLHPVFFKPLKFSQRRNELVIIQSGYSCICTINTGIEYLTVAGQILEQL
jgi:hypothetical protein